MSHNPKCKWLEAEWKLGKLYRDVLSMAREGGDPNDISDTFTQFNSLLTAGRNDLPFLEGP